MAENNCLKLGEGKAFISACLFENDEMIVENAVCDSDNFSRIGIVHNVSVIILYPKCQCHYPVPQVSVSLSCTPSVSVIILYPKCQCHYPVPQVSVSLSCTPSVSVIILYPKCLGFLGCVLWVVFLLEDEMTAHLKILDGGAEVLGQNLQTYTCCSFKKRFKQFLYHQRQDYHD
ncbi:unnamed protein product, partial [Ranitomeya imitator]